MMKRTVFKKGLVLLVGICLFYSSSFAYENLGLSASGTARGNAFTTSINSPTAIFYNPSAAVLLKSWQFTVLYGRLSNFGFPKQENPCLMSGALISPISDRFALGVGVGQKGSWSDPTDYVTHNLGQLTLSYLPLPELAIGFNGKFLFNSNYGDKKIFDFDLGVLLWGEKPFSLGLVGQNLLANNISTFSATNQVRTVRQVKAGFSYQFMQRNFLTLLAYDFTWKQEVDPEKKDYFLNSFGIEQWFWQNNSASFVLRGGFTQGKEFGLDYQQASFGAGVRFKGSNGWFYQLDYSWLNYPYEADEKLVGDHRISFTMGLGKLFSSEKNVALNLKPKRETPPREVLTPTPPQRQIGPQGRVSPEGNKLKLESSVEQLSSGRNRSVMFLLSPDIEIEVKTWKLFVVKEKPMDWNKTNMELYTIKTFEGKGLPAYGIMWDCKEKNNVIIKKGEYYYALIIEDISGNIWYSPWKSFKVE
jgi:hypothetical protein